MELEKYVDKVFYYCLKRCNNRFDAEDLSQIILTEAFISLEKNKNIENLESYIFKIAHNQYTKYIKSKVKTRQLIDYNYEIDSFETDDNKLNSLVEKERLKEINQRLKLLDSDYINIVYSYYVEDLKLSTIANNLNLPLGTVKRRLYDIRKKLKESLEMKVISGKKTYIPKDYYFTKSCNGVGTYDPHNFVQILIQKNLLYHSYNNPCSLEDYAIELGISMPYIEDLVSSLEKATLLKKHDGKYVTNFAFLSREFRAKIYDLISSYKESFALKLVEKAKNNINEFKKIGFSNSDLDDTKLYWNYLMIILLAIDEDSNLSFQYTKRPGNGKWDFIGYEILKEANEFYFVGLNIDGDYEGVLHVIDIRLPEIKNRILYNPDYNTLKYLYLNKISKISDTDPAILKNINNLEKHGIIRIEEDRIKFNVMIFGKEEADKLKEFLKSLKLESLVEVYKEIFEKIVNEVKAYLPNYLASQVKYIAFSLICDLRPLVYNVALEKGLLDLCVNQKSFVHNINIIFNR